MAKIHLDRLKKKYGTKYISGKNYSEIVKQILDNNQQNVSNKMNSLSQKKWENLSKKITTKEKRLVLPDLKEIVPPRALSVAKAAQNGELICDTLRDALTKDLRKSLDEFTVTGEQSYIRRRGVTAGRINPNLVKKFEQNITNTFSGYTKKDPKFGIPTNIHTIAVTEVRSAINMVKKQYIDKVLENNPDIVAEKIWIQNRGLSKIPRKEHSEVDGKRVGINDYFLVNRYKEVKGRMIKVGIDKMSYPHDPRAPKEQVIGCNCDYDIVVSRRKRRV